MSQFKFLPPRDIDIIRTPMIEQAGARILVAHEACGQFFVITGRAGAGKTSAGKYLSAAFSVACSEGRPNAFRACHYTSSDMRPVRADVLERLLLVELITKGLDLRITRDLRQLRVADLQRMAISTMKDRAIQAAFIDEAGMIPPTGLNVLANFMNEADLQKHPLTIVLIGMNELPLNVAALPQVERRVADAMWFEPVNAAQAIEVLRSVHPFFETLDLASPEGAEVIDVLLSPEASDGGMLGKVILLVQRAAKFAKLTGVAFGAESIRTALMIKAIDVERSKEDARGGYHGAHPEVSEEAARDAALGDSAPRLKVTVKRNAPQKARRSPYERAAVGS